MCQLCRKNLWLKGQSFRVKEEKLYLPRSNKEISGEKSNKSPNNDTSLSLLEVKKFEDESFTPERTIIEESSEGKELIPVLPFVFF